MPNGKERSGAQLGDPQLQVTVGAGQYPRPVPVALAGAGAGALVRDRADHRAELVSEPITYTTRGDAAVESNGQALDRVRWEILSGLHILRLRLRINCALTCL
jgi:hypothetical protein